MTFKRKTAQHGNAKAVNSKQMQADYIKRVLNPCDFYRYELPNAPLKKSGWNDGGLCPFHADTKAGSFRVNLITGSYKCFACGMAGGDILAFAMALYGLEFVDVLVKLVEDLGL